MKYSPKMVWPVIAICMHLKTSLALRSSLFTNTFLVFIKQVLFLIGWNFFFNKYQSLGGWDFNHMLLMYGVVCFGVGCIDAFCYGLRELPMIVATNQIDNFLLQPRNLILNIAFAKGEVSGFGEIITGLILITYSGFLLSHTPTVIIILILSVVFVFALHLYLGSIAFFVYDAQDFIKEISMNALIVASQPMAAYYGILKILTFSILPVAFLGFLPIEAIRTGLWKYLYLAICGTALFLVVAHKIFYVGLKRYESGNFFINRY